jgi:hypothetical protein
MQKRKYRYVQRHVGKFCAFSEQEAGVLLCFAIVA